MAAGVERRLWMLLLDVTLRLVAQQTCLKQQTLHLCLPYLPALSTSAQHPLAWLVDTWPTLQAWMIL
jgi:hypothetical protein